MMLNPGVLRNKKDFTAIYSKGQSLGDKFVVIFYRDNRLDYTRTAFLASKKVGKSVQRNKARRLMKESYREIKPSVKEGKDIIIIARNTINSAAYTQVKNSLVRALKRGSLLKDDIK